MTDDRDDDVWPGESYDTPKNEVAPVTDKPESVQEVVSDSADTSELEGEKNELAPVTDMPGSVQEVVEEPADDSENDGEVGDDE